MAPAIDAVVDMTPVRLCSTTALPANVAVIDNVPSALCSTIDAVVVVLVTVNVPSKSTSAPADVVPIRAPIQAVRLSLFVPTTTMLPDEDAAACDFSDSYTIPNPTPPLRSKRFVYPEGGVQVPCPVGSSMYKHAICTK